jgi:hypothetical protein
MMSAYSSGGCLNWRAFKSRGMCDSFLGEGEEGVSAAHILFKILKPIKNLLKESKLIVLIKF